MGSMSKSLSAKQIFDANEALDRVAGDQDLLKEIAQLLVQQLPNQIKQIQEGIDSNNAQAVLEAAHSLKGSVGNFSARRAYDAAYRLEQMGREGGLTGAGAALVDLRQELDALLEALKGHDML
ncbi:MAG: Hpt domain-containing protein [Thermodesulfobacteriota bacterium]|nr:Hpt domain-containing protein [Thermodesulfobacteriota bacterium]